MIRNIQKYSAVVILGLPCWVQAASLEQLERRIQALEAQVAEQEDILDSQAQTESPVHFGGYGEMHLNMLKQGDDQEIRELDFHRFVLFTGYDFSDRIRLVSELEVEHVIASAGNRGALELEQAYLEFDVADRHQIQAGLLLMPVGIINETHEPPRFYGVERPVVETTVIPSTWYANGVKYLYKIADGWQLDVMISEGLKTEDATAQADAEPFNIKKGKQKGSFASFYDPAYTARLAYRGVPGMALTGFVQYQPDLDQSAKISYADGATLVGGDVTYSWHQWQLKGLVSQWLLEGDLAKEAEQEKQFGAYIEASWRFAQAWGAFARGSVWSLAKNIDAQQINLGVNYYPHEDIVIKWDLQTQNEEAGDVRGLNMGIGYQF